MRVQTWLLGLLVLLLWGGSWYEPRGWEHEAWSTLFLLWGIAGGLSIPVGGIARMMRGQGKLGAPGLPTLRRGRGIATEEHLRRAVRAAQVEAPNLGK